MRADAEARLIRALTESAAAVGCTLTVEGCTSRPWASATFVGEQFSLGIALAPADTACAWLDALPEVELPMRGHVAMPPAVDWIGEKDNRLDVALTVLVLADSR